MDWVKLALQYVPIILLVIALIFIFKTPNIGKIKKEAEKWKAQYELVYKEYGESKKRYDEDLKTANEKVLGLQTEYVKYKTNSTKSLSKVTKEYNKLQAEYFKLKGASENVQKPVTSAERLARLRSLGYNPVDQQ
jgi:hypothetical protein